MDQSDTIGKIELIPYIIPGADTGFPVGGGANS